MLPSGTYVRSYRILSPLWIEGTLEVYRVMDLRCARELVLKAFPVYCNSDHASLELFQRQIKELAFLSHPNIATIHDIRFENNTCYIVSDLLEGETLQSRLEKSPLAWHKAVEWTIEIANALAAAHSIGMVHGDLQPKNLYVTKGGCLKILDFGVARLKGPRVGSVMNSVPYLSPEQIKGEDVDFRTDIFSLGSVLYEMIAGCSPFVRSSTVETANAILKEHPQRLAKLRKDVPPELDCVIAHCLEKKVVSRFPSAHDLIFELNEVLDVVKPNTVLPKNRHWTAAIAVIAVILILLYLKVCGS